MCLPRVSRGTPEVSLQVFSGSRVGLRYWGTPSVPAGGFLHGNPLPPPPQKHNMHEAAPAAARAGTKREAASP